MKKRFLLQEVEEPIINLTPLIDVVFVILIMFILMAPLLELDRVELASSPSTSQISVQEKGPLTIHVHRDNTIWLNGEKMRVENLAKNLQALKRLHPYAQPQLFHDKQAHFGTYQSVKDAIEAAGYDQVDVILKPG